MVLAYVPDRTLPQLIQIRNALEAQLGLIKATGTIVFDATPANVPTADDTLIISDGVTATTYTWKAAAAAANEVTIGATATLSGVNLLAAIQANSPATTDNEGNTLADPARGITATMASLTISLTNTVHGTLGNVAITDSTDNVTVTGMSGGADGVQADPI